MSALTELTTPTVNSLISLPTSNFSSRVKNMTNDEFNKVLNAVNSETKRQAMLRRFGNTSNSILRTRKNKVVALPLPV